MGFSVKRSGGPWLAIIVAVGVAVAACMVLVAAPPASSATSAKPSSTALEILAPKNFGRVTSPRFVARVRVRGPKFRATLDGRDVTARFGPRKGGVRSATFRRRKDFRAGQNALRVEVGRPKSRSFKTVSSVFRAAVRADGRMKVRRLAGGSPRAPLHLRMRTTRRIDTVRVRVNGKRARSALPLHRDAKGVTAKLGAFDHVRYGRNEVLADVEYRDGKVSKTRGSFRVSRARPLAGAGRDRTMVAGRRVTVTGGSSRAARPGARLSYRWKVVSGPKRSGAKLDDPSSMRTGFTASKPGRYRLRLQVEGRGGPGSAVDEVEILSAPTDDPMGVPVRTFLPDGVSSIQVGPATYECPAFTWVHVVVVDAAHLSPADGGSQCFNQNETDELLDAVSSSTHPNLRDDLVIASGFGLDAAAQGEWGPVLTKFFNAIGGTTSTTGPNLGGQTPFVQSDWSLIGHAGLAPGEAVQRLRGTDADGEGGLNGHLQKVDTRAYDFVSPEFATLDTHAPSSTPTENVVEVGPSQGGPGGTYSSSPLPGGRSQGFQLLELVPDTLEPIWNETYVTRNADGSVNGNGIGALAQRLDYLTGNHYFGDENPLTPPLVIVQSFGEASNAGARPVGNDTGWVNDSLPGWGQSRGPYNGNRYDYFGWCGGSAATESLNGYSCKQFPNSATGLGSNATVTRAIGLMAGMSERTAVANFGLHGAPEALSMVGSPHPYSDDEVWVEVGANGTRTVATLRRTNQSQWRAAAPSPVGNFDASGMWELAFASPTPWPCSAEQPTPCPGSASQVAEASAYIANQLWPGAGYTDVREAYVPHISDGWNSNIRSLNGLDFPTHGVDFDQSTFDALQVQLATEFSKISSVDNMFNRYELVFATTASTDALLNMQSIGNEIMTAAFEDNAAYQAEQVEVSHKDVTGGILRLAASVLNLATLGRSAAVIGVAAGAYDLYEDMTEPDDYPSTGQVPFDEPNRIRDRADLVGADLVSRYQGLNDTLDHLELIFVNDWGKLQTAYANANGDWSLDKGSQAESDLVQTSAMGAEAAFYKALMPVAYDQWFVSPSFTYTGSNEGNEYGNGEYYGSQLAMSHPGPTGYVCQPGPPPFADAPASTMDWVRYTATGSASDDVGSIALSSVGRVLKSKADPLTLQTATWADYPDATNLFPATENAGAPPPLDPTTHDPLTDKLFQEPSPFSLDTDPDGLDMEKDEFFGMSTWDTPRLQCGRPQYLGPTGP